MFRPVALNFEKEVSSKILKGSCTAVSATGLFPVEEVASAKPRCSLRAERTYAGG